MAFLLLAKYIVRIANLSFLNSLGEYFPFLVSSFECPLTCLEQGKKKKKFFWVPAIAPMISVVVSTFFVYITRADKDGVQIVSTGLHFSSLDQEKVDG